MYRIKKKLSAVSQKFPLLQMTNKLCNNFLGSDIQFIFVHGSSDVDFFSTEHIKNYH